MADGLREDPRTGINWHRHPRGCPNYRERWPVDSDLQKGEPLYQVFCLLNTPPVTAEEQAKCMASHTQCWRLASKRSRAPKKESAPATEAYPNP